MESVCNSRKQSNKPFNVRIVQRPHALTPKFSQIIFRVIRKTQNVLATIDWRIITRTFSLDGAMIVL